MAGLLDSVGGLLTPDNIGAIGKALGMDSGQVQQGMNVAEATVLGSLSKTAQTPAGMESLTKLMPQDTGGSPTDMIGGLLGSLSGGGTSADMMNNVMGGGVNAISGTLSQSLGFDIKPLLTMAVPMVMGVIAKTAKSQNLNSAGVSKLLKDESQAYLADPANKQVSDMVQSSLKAGDDALALKQKFSDADWMKMRMAPMAAVYLVGTASPSNESGQREELAAAAGAVGSAIKSASPTSLIGTAFGGGLTKNELEILAKDAPPRERLLGVIKEGVATVQTTSPADTPSYKAMILDAAQKAAEATKEGGFLGIGGTRVTKEEQQALDDIRAAVG